MFSVQVVEEVEALQYLHCNYATVSTIDISLWMLIIFLRYRGFIITTEKADWSVLICAICGPKKNIYC